MTRFPQEMGSASLEAVIAHAYEIQRSEPANFPDLVYYPSIQRDAAALVAAHRMGAPEADLIGHAEILNRTLTHVRAAKATPRSNKPTVGKATDRLGEKQRRVEEKAAKRVEKRERAKASSRRAETVLGGGR